jgi:isoleucyl-tRNA synthetase
MATDPSDSRRDYRATLFLPETGFPMKAGLPEAEPKWLKRWDEMDVYGRLRQRAKGRPLYLLHDGPPYANGDIHIGTALNKILKDFVVRSQSMLGKDAPYVPGWDCHGLPIEWKIEEEYRAKGRSKDEVPVAELRARCRAFAEHWIGVQRDQFKRLGGIGLWQRPYTTMEFAAEAQIVRELHKFVDNGLLYRGARPVMWSPVERTALAEAEIEYQEKTSPQIYVKFPIAGVNAEGQDEESAIWQTASLVIWTTTPWTIPGNRAIAYSPTIKYGLYRVEEAAEGSFARVGELLVLSDDLAKDVFHAAKITSWTRVRDANPRQFDYCDHPLHGFGYEFRVPVLAGEHVTSETGTGFVHTAPGHGEDDYALWRANQSHYIIAKDPAVPETVGEDGSFLPHVPLFAGKRVLTPEGKDGDANGAVIKELITSGKLLAKGSFRHQYPHSWRSKAPVIFRATPQWFIAVDKEVTAGNRKGTLRELALNAIAETRWYPRAGENRIGAMVRERPDWVLSRQRAWGVPIAVFVSRKDGQLLRDNDVNARIAEAFDAEGADAWFNSEPARFLAPKYDSGDYEQVTDILDVWFDSGSTHAFTLENPIEPGWPRASHADLYLEGSDQHRGWFQSSLLESCGTRGRAPYDAVLTHGFVLDEQGRKMAKSLGNTVAPQKVVDQNGAEILRLWVASSDFTEDLRIGPEIIKANVDAYRRLRNTIRFLLANLSGFTPEERISHEKMPELERFILARLAQLDRLVREGYAHYDYNHVFSALFTFATSDLSAFYFDIRKDSLYCDVKTAARRRAARTVLDALFARIVTWLAPILCFTMEEAWVTRFGTGESVHLETFPETPQGWADEALLAKWLRVRNLRRVVTGALEIARRDKIIGASLEATPTLYVEAAADFALLKDIDLSELAITSGAKVVQGGAPEGAFRLPDVAGAAVVFAKADGEKCARCWMVLPEVGKVAGHPDLCRRCSDAVG